LAALPVLPAALLLAASCGDPLLPADFQGPPESEVSGNVLAPAAGLKDATRPGLSLEWLSGLEPGAGLVGQTVSFRRSSKLEADWDIGVGAPAEGARFDTAAGASRRVRLGVGKLVYFDDRAADGRLTWDCEATTCDLIKAVSAQIVVYVETPPTCQAREGGPLRSRIAPGYHYFSFEGGGAHEVGGTALTFTVTGRPPREADVVAELRAFTATLLRAWGVSSLEGC
jgi:hypothetical protein